MASNSPAPEGLSDRFNAFGARGAAGTDDDATTWGEWNPTEDSLRQQARSGGRHRVVKQRSGFARSSTVLGVGVIAAVGAGGMATAKDKPPVSISLPDLNLPDASELPGVGEFLSDGAEGTDGSGSGTNNPQPLTATLALPAESAGKTAGTESTASAATADAGEALRARILQQAEQQQANADAAEKAAAEKAAAEKAAAEAAVQAEKAEKEAAAAKKKAEEEAAAKAEAERLAKLAASYSLPTSSYTLTSTYGQSGSMWSSGQHTGLDFAAPTGTPVKAVNGGTIKSAGWSGSYGYRIVLELEDGTEVWYAHLSSMTVSAGQSVGTGDTIGRVGATGNVTGPHLHLEIHTPGGSGLDPAAWLANKGISV
ncbi:M23 family metallopeptidase [Streptomyces sp. P9(2023)]|uniref:M23 family metallopeptidase n=1 Tax=Streptomyces sp. P9(2023) TaxID=3064394 RepID=UPI0028F42DA4|nr:M23 family metallopeptidase [Streptomyces sp. P9(2023)]MDT9693459.1 M23 family metallopeptidase [Streptomyces sp. P9(2023)]